MNTCPYTQCDLYKFNYKVIYHILAVIVILYWSFENLIMYHILKEDLFSADIIANSIVYILIIYWLIHEGYK